MKNRVIISLLFVGIILSSCSENADNQLEGKVKYEVISLAPKISGRILKINVLEGDVVKAGDTLAVLDVPEVEAKMRQAGGVRESANSQHQMALHGATVQEREQAIAGYNATMEKYKFAEKSYKRISNMYKDSLVSTQMYDQTFAEYNAAKAQADLAKAKMNEVVNGVRSEKIDMAKGQLDQASGLVQEAEIAYSERFIIAPKNMTIETIALREGELALAGYNFFVGYEVGKAYFRFTVRESQISQFKKGNDYKITLPFDNKQIDAKLVAIKQLASYANKTSAYPNYQLGESVYELKLNPVSSHSTDSIYNNYTALLIYKSNN